jgi:hypothetical protein
VNDAEIFSSVRDRRRDREDRIVAVRGVVDPRDPRGVRRKDVRERDECGEDQGEHEAERAQAPSPRREDSSGGTLPGEAAVEGASRWRA